MHYVLNQHILEISGSTNRNRIKINHLMVSHVIRNHINLKKSSGYNYINDQRRLSDEAIKCFTKMFNAHIGYFPTAWKITIIIIIKPEKDAQKVESDGFLSLLPIFSKVCEKNHLNKTNE